jgi:hypothetical protein
MPGSTWYAISGQRNVYSFIQKDALVAFLLKLSLAYLVRNLEICKSGVDKLPGTSTDTGC